MTASVRRALRAAREARGLTQAGLAEAAGVSRQSLVAIESGRSEPSVGLALRLARILERPVEQLFSSPGMPVHIDVFPARAPQGTVAASKRQAIGLVENRWVAHPLPDHRPETMTQSADAVRTRCGRRRGPLEVELLRPPEEIRDNVLLVGCAPALGLLATRLNRSSGPGRFVWLPLPSRASLRALASGEAHVAGVHMGSGSDDDNVAAVRAQVKDRPTCIVTLTAWETVLASCTDALRVRDLARPRVRIAAREPGSGARAVLERTLRAEKLTPRKRLADAIIAQGHLEVARLVASGTADAGVTLRSTAVAHGLAFTPLETERFDLVLFADALHDHRIGRLLDALTHAAFRTEIASLDGHDPRDAGRTVARLD